MARVLFFAGARIAAGCDETDLAIDGQLAQDEFWQRLVAQFPKLAALRETTRLAKNHAYLEGGGTISSGDEIALIPPVSGG